MAPIKRSHLCHISKNFIWKINSNTVLGVHWKDWCWSWNSQYFEHLMWRADSFEKMLMLGKIEGRRRRGQQKMRWWMASLTWWTWVWMDSGSWWCTGRPGVLWFMGSQRVRHNWATELNWTDWPDYQFFTSRQLFVWKMFPQPAGVRECFIKACWIPKHGYFN